MFDRDNYWPTKIERLIQESPGINLTQLRQRTQKITTQERRRYLDELQASGRITRSEVEAAGGQRGIALWPATAPAHSGPIDSTAQAETEIVEARRLLTSASARIDAALRSLQQPTELAEGGAA